MLYEAFLLFAMIRLHYFIGVASEMFALLHSHCFQGLRAKAVSHRCSAR